MELGPTTIREFADGVFWLGGCQARTRLGEETHVHSSTFLVKGADKALLVDTGHPSHWEVVEAGLDHALGGRPLDYVFPTHTEYPHAGNLKRLLRKYPLIEVVGDVRDYHLYYPDFFVTGCFVPMAEGDELDLGGRRFVLVPALLRDLPNTLWGYDTASETMFVSDGFAYAHRHGAGECRIKSSEYDPAPKHKHAVLSNETALFWPKYVDIDEYWAEFEVQFQDYPPTLIAPAHGGVIDSPDVMIPMLKQVFVDMRKKGLEEQAELRSRESAQ